MAVSSTPQAPESVSTAKAALAELASQNILPESFFQQFLHLAVPALDGLAGSAWGLNRDGLFTPIAELKLAAAGIAQDSPTARRHIQLLLHVLHTGQSLVCSPDGKGLSLSPGGEKLLLVPLVCESNCLGVVEVCLPAETPSEQVAERLASLQLLAHSASSYLKRQIVEAQFATDTSPSLSFDTFSVAVHRSLNLENVGSAIVNEGRILLGCDRLSLAVKRGRQIRIQAVSGHERIVERSNLVRAMTSLARLVAERGEPIHYTGAIQELAPQLQQPLLEYLSESNARSLQVVPLFEAAATAAETSAQPWETKAVCGVAFLEHFAGDAPRISASQLQRFTAHVELAICNAIAFDRGVTEVWWRKVERYLPSWAAAAPARLVAILCAAAFAMTLLLLLPVSYRVEAKGLLVPVVRQGVFAPTDAEVVEVLVQGGEQVKQGQILLRLRNDELAMEHLLVRNQLQEKQQLVAALQAESGGPDRSANRDVAIRLQGQISKTQIEIDGLSERLKDLERSVAALEIKAAIAGTVASFQPRQQLLHRPVQRGEQLLELMDEQGAWKLELDVPAYRIVHLNAATQAVESAHLPVYFVTSTMPDRLLLGYVHRIATRTSLAADQTAVVKLDVAIDANEMPDRTAGAEVFARVGCGQRSLGYVLFGDVTDYVSHRLW